MIGFELDCEFVIVEKIFVSGIWSISKIRKGLKMKMKNEEKKSTSSTILEQYHCEKNFKKYLLDQKIQL